MIKILGDPYQNFNKAKKEKQKKARLLQNSQDILAKEELKEMHNYPKNLVLINRQDARKNDDFKALSFKQQQIVNDQLSNIEKKKCSGVGRSFVQTQNNINQMIDQGYTIEIPEKFKWHQS